MTDFHRWKGRLDAKGRYPVENGPPFRAPDGSAVWPGGPYAAPVDNKDGTWSIWIFGDVPTGKTYTYNVTAYTSEAAAGSGALAVAGPSDEATTAAAVATQLGVDITSCTFAAAGNVITATAVTGFVTGIQASIDIADT